MKQDLNTRRLLLAPCGREDTEGIHRLWTHPGICRFLFDGHEIPLRETRSLLEASLTNFERYNFGIWLVFERDSGVLIGFAGLLEGETNAPNLVFGVHPDFWGRGYATEAAGEVLRYASETLALPLIKADVDEPNRASARVLEKLGMKRTRRGLVEGRPLLYFEKSV